MAHRVFIHAGAHRTGSSSFQNCLAENRAALAAAGYDLAYPSRDGAAGGTLRLARRLPRPGNLTPVEESAGLRDYFRRFFTQPGNDLILSEENLIGRIKPLLKGRFFTMAARRMRAVAAGFDAPVEHLLLVIRSYDSFFESAYRKQAEENLVDPFADLCSTISGRSRGWAELVTEIAGNLKPQRITVLDYALRGSSVEVLSRLVPDLDPVVLREPARTLNQSATDAALIALQSKYRAGAGPDPDLIRDLIEQHAETTESRGFAEFDPGLRNRLRAEYTRDLDRIERTPGVTLLRGEAVS